VGLGPGREGDRQVYVSCSGGKFKEIRSGRGRRRG
jgi:hypothetical protein